MGNVKGRREGKGIVTSRISEMVSVRIREHDKGGVRAEATVGVRVL